MNKSKQMKRHNWTESSPDVSVIFDYKVDVKETMEANKKR